MTRTPTQQDYKLLADIALHVAAAPATRRNPLSHNAMVPWVVINDLRLVCDRLGLDWRGLRPDE